MQGHTIKRRSGARRVGYQCVYRTEYPGDDSHPKTLFLAEDRILPNVDEWLADLTSPDRLDSTVMAILAADAHETTDSPELPELVEQLRRAAITRRVNASSR